MKKLLALAIIAALGVASAAYAAPLRSYGAGKTAIDVGMNLPTNNDYDGYSVGSKETSPYAGITVGISEKAALNYKWNQYKNDHDTQLDTQQLNLMYKLLPGLDVYAGYLNTDTDLYGHGRNTNSAQFGLQGNIKLPLDFTVWTRTAIGSKIKGYEIGLSRPLLSNVDLNLSYYDHKYDEAAIHDTDVRTKGVNVGVTLKF